MSNWVYTIYGGYDQISQALTMMTLIFHDQQYKGMWFGVAVIGIIVSALTYYFKALSSGQGGGMLGLSWLAKPLIGIVLMFSFIRTEANLQLIDYTGGKTGAYTVPLGLAVVMSTLNKIEIGMVDIISSVGDVNSPNNYRKFSGGAGFDLFQKTHKHRNLPELMNLQAYYTDCFAMTNALLQWQTFDVRDFNYGDGTTDHDFFEILASGSGVLLTTVDYTQQPTTQVTCYDSWNTIYPYFSNPNNFQDDLATLCSEHGYDSTDSQQLANCTEKMNIILQQDTNKPAMSAQTYLGMKAAAETALNNLSDDDPNNVAVSQASKSLQSQGLGIGAVFTHFAPVVRSIMWSLIIMLMPLCALFIASPLFPKVFSFVAGLMVLMTSWTIIDCAIHTAMQQYIASQFTSLQSMGTGILYYIQMSNVSTEVVGIYGMIKGSSLILATAFSGIFSLQGSHAMAQFAGGIQGSLDNAGRSAGNTAFTTEGRSQALNAQYQVGESMTNAHRWAPSEHFEKGRINAESSMGHSMGIKRGNEEAIEKGLIRKGSSIADYTSETGYRDAQNKIGGFKTQEDGMKTAKAMGIFPQNGNLTDFAQASGNSKHSLVGTDGKSYSMAVDQSGKAVWSKTEEGFSANIASNDQTRPTESHAKTNLGALSLMHKNGISNTKTDIIRNAEKDSKAASDTLGTSRSAARTEEDSFSKTLNNSKSVSKADKQVTNNGFSRTVSVNDSDADKVSKNTQITKDQASSFMNKVQAQVRANASAGFKIPLTEVGATVTGEMSKSGEISNATSLKKLSTELSGKDYSHITTDAEAHNRNINQIREKGVASGDTKLVAGVDSLKASYTSQATAGSNFTTSVNKEKDLSTAIQTMTNNGTETSFDDSARLQAQLETTHGKDGARQILNDVNNVSDENASFKAESLAQQASNKVSKKYSGAVYAEADKIRAEREAGSSTIGARIDTAQASFPSPEGAYKTEKTEIDTARKGGHVEAGHNIGSVNTAITPSDINATRKGLGKHVATPTQAIRNEMASDEKRLEHMQSGINVVAPPVVLATMVNPDAGMIVAEKSGHVVNAVEDFGISAAKAVPGLATAFAKEAVPIAFPSEHERMTAEIKGMLGRRLEGK